MSGKRKAKFRVGQLVCLKLFGLPVGAVVLTTQLPNGFWQGVIEQDNREDEREFMESELRPLTARERGPKP